MGHSPSCPPRSRAWAAAPHPGPLPLTPPSSAITAAPTSEQIPGVRGGRVREGGRHLGKVERGCQPSVPAEESSLRRALAPDLRGGDAGPCHWAPSPWLQGREPARTCCPGAAQGRSTSHHLPSDGRTGTWASAACSPSIRLQCWGPGRVQMQEAGKARDHSR